MKDTDGDTMFSNLTDNRTPSNFSSAITSNSITMMVDSDSTEMQSSNWVSDIIQIQSNVIGKLIQLLKFEVELDLQRIGILTLATLLLKVEGSKRLCLEAGCRGVLEVIMGSNDKDLVSYSGATLRLLN